MSNVTIRSYRKEREKEITDGLQKSMEKVGALVERQAKINVTKSPPEHPQVQTGRLRSSIIHQVTNEGNEITAEIGTNVVYSKYLEFGTSRHSPFPWLFPAVELKKPKIIEILKKSGGKNVTITEG
jgi:HK97 gp10 family phage protein